MANIKSAKKRALTSMKARDRNRAKKTAMRNAIKKLNEAIVLKNEKELPELLKFATKKIDKAAGNGIVHANYAARQKSRLTIKVNNVKGS